MPCAAASHSRLCLEGLCDHFGRNKVVATQPLQYTVAHTNRHVYYICGMYKHMWMGCMARPVQWDSYRSKLCWVTISGYVMLRAMLHGTPSSSMAMLGSPDMTVRAEKSTRLPIRLPLTRPDLPFRRWPIDSNGLPERCTERYAAS